ncbi:MAG: DUF4160 domain-containing protein [Turicibacter sp.]|nr:DUF4160 domain-containing protein [Turicibacter sp.]
MTLTKLGNYHLYFTARDVNESAHLHANSPKPVKVGAAKIWIRSDGTAEIAKKGNISNKDLKMICTHITENYLFYLHEWEKYFNSLQIHGEPNKEFTITVDKGTGELKLKELETSNVFKK